MGSDDDDDDDDDGDDDDDDEEGDDDTTFSLFAQAQPVPMPWLGNLSCLGTTHLELSDPEPFLQLPPLSWLIVSVGFFTA